MAGPAMHTLWSRGNALLTNFLLVAAAMAVLVTITGALPALCECWYGALEQLGLAQASLIKIARLADFLTVPTMPEVDISVKKLNFFQPNNSGDDQVGSSCSMSRTWRCAALCAHTCTSVWALRVCVNSCAPRVKLIKPSRLDPPSRRCSTGLAEDIGHG